MKEVMIDEIQRLAESWQAQEKQWHFHMLTPKCDFNNRSDQHAFVLENRSDKETFVTYSSVRYMDVGKRLVQLLHGEKVLSDAEPSSSLSNETIREIVARAEGLNSHGILWHHHMLFPDCVFNKHLGMWNIVFEDNQSGGILEALYEEEPTGDLRSVELLYYAQKS